MSAFLLLGGQIDAQAGFLEDLFGAFGGGGQQWGAEPRAASRRLERPRRREVRSSLEYLKASPKQKAPQKKYSKRPQSLASKDSDDVSAAGPIKKGFCYDQPPQGADPGEAEALLHDATLRAGDAIATAEGLRIYQGSSGCPHKPGDFLALVDARGVKGARLNSLQAIENAMKIRADEAAARSLFSSARDQEAMSH
ncbi:hypothetical protein [Methylocystis heyeri]|uniref:hypothetical protein n=1 Tax=Methylocystis heyeri TaxID=391905 RepID=UPI0010A62661|nr:hypothetical protein [Methylocystis heyeri]